MGLFRKKTNDAEHLQKMQEQMAAMRQRLDESDAEKAQLASRLGYLDAENQRLSNQVGDVEVQVVTVQGKVGSVESQVGDVASKVALEVPEAAAVSAHVDDIEQRLADQVAALTATVEEQQLRLADLALVAKDTAEKAASDADTAPDQSVDEELRAQIGQIAEKMTALDGRVTQISVELTNQLTELGNEVDAVNERGGDATALEARIESITDGQRRLANEQARYEIQFREDLAELVERLRRPNAR